MFPSLRAASYVLVHAPDMVIHNGSTQVVERTVNPESEYLKALPNHLRTFEEVVAYAPNQVYIGNMKPEELREIKEPWFDKPVASASADGPMGRIFEERLLIGLIKACDAFDLVLLEESFTEEVQPDIEALNLPEKYKKLKSGVEIERIQSEIEDRHAEPLVTGGKVVGCVKRAHDIDPNLDSHVILENLVVKATGVLSGLELLKKYDIDPLSIPYVIECSEEAAGDMNQRGGGNFAKSIAEIIGADNATGSDTRGFCAAPMHAIVKACALVKAGVYENVLVLAGGATAKLGMNGKDHLKKDLPILEDVLGGFALLITENDGVHPIFRTDLIGRHTVGTGSSPQAVMTSLITGPLDKAGLKITDIDVYSVEMQNPDVTKPAGAGDVANANYKMIAALAVMRKEIERAQINDFVRTHGLPGWAPTQGHIPSGVPYVGHALQSFLNGDIEKAMIVGKGSLFLARMTNLFDGVSIIMEKNPGVAEEAGVSKDDIRKMLSEALRDFAASLGE
ncbi:MAG: glycine reductase [Tissierellia bacterium]|nr:glycine/sarcosine/betaine reductase complex component C subunit beta [Bacillota bacterium]NLL23419.1 glycine reductase [Tissierellia bacterium]